MLGLPWPNITENNLRVKLHDEISRFFARAVVIRRRKLFLCEKKSFRPRPNKEETWKRGPTKIEIRTFKGGKKIFGWLISSKLEESVIWIPIRMEKTSWERVNRIAIQLQKKNSFYSMYYFAGQEYADILGTKCMAIMEILLLWIWQPWPIQSDLTWRAVKGVLSRDFQDNRRLLKEQKCKKKKQ